MKRRIQLVITGLIACAAMSTHAGQYDDVVDYRNLTKDNLPHMQVVIQEAMDRRSTGQMDAQKMKKRVRWSYLLPMVEVRYGKAQHQEYGYGDATIIYEREYDDGRMLIEERTFETQTYQTDQWQPFWHVFAEWELSKLIFSREESYSRYVREQQSFYQQRMLKELVTLYKELKELMDQRVDDEDIMLEIDISAVAVKLDFLTGDYLTLVIRSTIQSAPASGQTADNGNTSSPVAGEGSDELSRLVQSLNNDGGNVFTAKTVQ